MNGNRLLHLPKRTDGIQNSTRLIFLQKLKTTTPKPKPKRCFHNAIKHIFKTEILPLCKHDKQSCRYVVSMLSPLRFDEGDTPQKCTHIKSVMSKTAAKPRGIRSNLLWIIRV